MEIHGRSYFPTMDHFFHNLDWVVPLRSDWLTPIFSFFSWLGYSKFFFFSLPLLYWTWNKKSATRLAVILAVGALITFFLKDLFKDPRPPAEYWMPGQDLETYGLPSGHTLIAIVFWMTLAAEVGRRWVTLVCCVIVAGIAFSRLYLGVHDVEDILGGAMLGWVLFGFSRWSFSSKVKLWEKHPSAAKIGLAVLFPILLHGFWPDGTPRETAWMLTGFLPAWVFGRVLEMRWFDARRISAGKTVAGVSVGICLGGATKFGLEILEKHGGLPIPAYEIAEGIVLGLALTLAVPALLCAIRLMRPARFET